MSQLVHRLPVHDQPDCPHTATEIRVACDLGRFADTNCLVCGDKWFEVIEGAITIPVVMPCGHACCTICFTRWRAISLRCPKRCALLPRNNEGCNACRDFVGAGNTAPPLLLLPRRMYQNISVVKVERDMLDELLSHIDDLTAADDFFLVSAKCYRRLTQYFSQCLYDFEGQFHFVGDLAKLLDPFRGADVDPDEATVTFAELQDPFPTPEVYGYDTLENPEQPWITTFLAGMALIWHDTRTVTKPTYDHGDDNDHMLPQDADGNTVWDFPIERIVGHRFNAHDQIEYKIEYIRFSHPDDHEWESPVDIRRPIIYQLYNRRHGIVINEHWIQADEVEDEDVEMEDVGDAMEEDEDEDAEEEEYSGDETDDGDKTGDYVP